MRPARRVGSSAEPISRRVDVTDGVAAAFPDTTTVLRPTDLAGAVAALADTAGPALVRGAGTAADWAGEPVPPAVVVDTTALTGVLTHNPGDMTVAVRAGTPLRELNAELAGSDQRVALDAARVGLGATVGGLLATADAGPAALAHGSLRDLVIGTTLVLADGTCARSGGHVIKNVAGYDLTKLVHGAHGTLALVAEVVLRLHPMVAAATVRLATPLAEAAGAARAVLGSPLEPAALEWCDGALLARLTGDPDILPNRARRLADLLGPDAEPLDDTAAGAAWAGHAELVAGPGGRPPPGTAVLRLGVRPSRLPGLLARLTDEAGATGAVAGLATGVATVRLPAEADPVTRAHRLVHEAGGVSSLRSRPQGCPAPGWGPEPTALGVLRGVRARLDPAGRLGGGRLAPWM